MEDYASNAAANTITWMKDYHKETYNRKKFGVVLLRVGYTKEKCSRFTFKFLDNKHNVGSLIDKVYVVIACEAPLV